MTPILRKLVSTSLITAALLSPQLRADDTDLYTGGEAATGAEANVLIIIDNGSDWNTAKQGWPDGKQGAEEYQALSEIIGTLGDSINIGMQMAAGQGGGYIRFAIRSMGSTNKGALKDMLDKMVVNYDIAAERNDDQVSSADVNYDYMMSTAARYFNGTKRHGTRDLKSGSDKDLRDYDGNNIDPTKQTAFPRGLGGYSLTNSAAFDTSPGSYTQPTTVAGGCAKNFIIFMGQSYPNKVGAEADFADVETKLGVTAEKNIAAVTSGDTARYADEWARFLYKYGVKSTVNDPKNSSQKLWNKVTTYTIDICKDKCDDSQAKLLKSMSKEGGGKYFKSTSKAEIKNALALIFAEIQAVNSVFASATLPISVNTQGTFENQVYIGVFRPDGGARPRWYGNLKEYKFGRYCDADRNDKVQIDNTRTLVNGMIPATLTGTATGAVTGTFTGSITNQAGTSSAVSGTVTGTISGTASATLAATFGASAGTTASPAADRGAGTVTGTVTDSSSRSSTFTGILNGTASLSGEKTSTDERVGDDVPAPSCGTDGSGKIPLNLFMGDKNGYRAIDEEGNTGFIDLSAKSYWTDTSSFWTFSPSDSGSTSDSPDGPLVERGGAAFRLRNTWSATPATNQTDGRNIVTCLSSCLSATRTDASEDTTNLTLKTHYFTTANSAVTTALAAPSGAASVTLVRSGTTVTGTVNASGTHPFADGNSVVIAGVTGAGTDGSGTVTDYNGTKTVTTGGSNTTFSYTITETPALSVTGTASFSSGSTSRTINSIALSGTGCTSGACKPGNTVTATLVASGTVGATADIAGTAGGLTVTGSESNNFLDKTGSAMTNTSGTTYTYSLALPAAPAAATGATATMAGATTPTKTGMSIAFDATNNLFTLSCVPACSNASGKNNPLNGLTPGSSVDVTNASDPKYNGRWVIQSTGKVSTTLYYRYYGGCGVTVGNPTVTGTPNFAPATCGGTATSGGAPSTENITITRTAGATSASVTTAAAGFNTAPNILANTNNVSITATGYTNSYAVSGVTHSGAVGTGTTTFTISGITTGPAAPGGAPTATLSGAGSGPPTTSLINWTRGKDLWEDENINASLTDVRASIHGDVLHARPVVVNYGGTIGIYAFYGSNDGFLRALHGGLSSVDGEEKWAFIPTEFVNYSKLARLYSNSPLLRYPNSSCSISPSPTARDYFWDGVTTAYQSSTSVYYTSNPATTTTTEPTAGCFAAGTCYKRPDKSWIFATMRRGGRALYALDVTLPDNPKFMWRVTNSTSGFSELAQTWSEPKLTKLKGTFTRSGGWSAITNPVVVVFGAGYDAAQEDKPAGSRVTPTMGRGVFVVDAESGQLIQFLQPTSGVTGYSFAADVNVLDLNNDGYVDRIYAADTNANVFRFDTVQTVTDVASSGYWKRYHIAKLGDTDNNGGANARKFMFQPEVLPFTYAGTTKALVLIGSGNREKPLPNFETTGASRRLTCQAAPGPFYSDTYFPPYSGTGDDNNYKVNDRFFGLVDAVQSGAVENTVNSNTIVLGNLTWINEDPNSLRTYNLAGSDRGWQILLRNDPDGSTASSLSEEKTVNAARVVAGTVFFATNSPVVPNPSAGICSNLGEALGYAVAPFTGQPAFNRDDSVDGSGTPTYTATDYATKFAGGGLPPTVTTGVVTIGGTPYRFAIGTGSTDVTSASSIAGTEVKLNLTGTRTKLYWSYGAD